MPAAFDAFLEAFSHVPAMLLGLERDGMGGLSLNLLLSLAAVPLSLAGGALIAAVRFLRIPVACGIAKAYVEAAKSLPLLLLVFWLHYALPHFTGWNPPLFATAVSGLVLLGSAHAAEVFRSGARTVETAQCEAAMLAGLPRHAVFRLVVLPQAAGIMLPAFLGVVVTLFKDSSLVFVIGLLELTHTGMLLANRHPDALPAFYVLIALGYMTVCLLLSHLESRLRRRLRKEGMNVPDGAEQGSL